MYTSTHTHTRFFSEGDITTLREAAIALQTDWDKRRPHIRGPILDQGDTRLGILHRIIDLLEEVPTDES